MDLYMLFDKAAEAGIVFKSIEPVGQYIQGEALNRYGKSKSFSILSDKADNSVVVRKLMNVMNNS